MFDAELFGKAMGEQIKSAVAPLHARIASLENELAVRKDQPSLDDVVAKHIATLPAPKDGLDAPPITAEQLSKSVAEYMAANPPAAGKDGTDAEPVSADDIAKAVSAYLELNPPAKGDSGKDAEPVTPEQIAEHVHAYMTENPPKDGKDGTDAEPVSVPDIVAELMDAPGIKGIVNLLVAEGIETHFKANPVKDGKDAPPVAADEIAAIVAKHLVENPPPKGEAGNDGVGIAGAMIDRQGELIVTTTKGEAIRLGAVVGKDGIAGRDGFGFDDLDAAYDGERTVTLKYLRDGNTKSFEWKLPIVIYRGYWREGMAVEKGDSMTHARNLWIALRDTKAKPARENTDDWILAVPKGMDGAPGERGAPYIPPGPVSLKKDGNPDA